ncbi:MAG: BlaI/MecI/CopY family transcriptional regulator [Deltaproteobacteria bacterium]|nr:BlaI/MecI/CopY family transcriptional regulator [Deltaproteobacteria bacterium]
MKKILSVFGADKRDFEGVLGSLERDVMDALWEKEEASGREVYEHLKFSRDIAITTVLTVIERLVKKGLVKKTRGESTYIYTPASSREDFTQNVSRDVFKMVMRMSSSDAVASFVDIVADISPEELDRLRRLIDEKKKKMELTKEV